MKFTFDLRWNPMRRWGAREEPPKELALYTLLTVCLGACFIGAVALAGDPAGNTLHLVLQCTGILCGLVAGRILARDLRRQHRAMQEFNLHTALLLAGTLLGCIALAADRWLLMRLMPGLFR